MTHRDLKPSNILINEQKQIKILDFGFSIYKNSTLHTDCGTKGYKAPEVENKWYKKTCDVYSVGKILEFLFQEQDISKIPYLEDFIKNLTADEENWLTAYAALNHEWLKDESVPQTLEITCSKKLRKVLLWDEICKCFWLFIIFRLHNTKEVKSGMAK